MHPTSSDANAVFTSVQCARLDITDRLEMITIPTGVMTGGIGNDNPCIHGAVLHLFAPTQFALRDFPDWDAMVTVMSEIICPKCGAAMRSYERNAVTIEQCTDCRGVFLDRGELDRMIDAESQRYAEPARQPAAAVYHDEYRDSDRYDDKERRHSDGHGYKKKKRHGFLSELFDD
jgi:Zn-finger nucleic acid-binding protein